MIGVGVAGHQGSVTVTVNLSFASAFLSVTDIVSSNVTLLMILTFVLMGLHVRSLRTPDMSRSSLSSQR